MRTSSSFLTVAFFILTTGSVHAATINAATCNGSDVLAAWNAAANGDTIQIPAGSCTWSSTLRLNSQTSRVKMVKLIGAGTDASTGTRITAGASGEILEIWLSNNISSLEISNIRFIQGSSWTNSDEEAVWAITLNGHADTQTSLFRIHHNVFVQKATGDNCCPGGNIVNSILVGGANSYGSPDNGHPYIWGLFDHNTWQGNVSFQAVDVLPRNDTQADGTGIYGGGTGNLGHLAWRDWLIADHQGTWRNVFFEDNNFTAAGLQVSQAALDTGTGGTIVARYNTFTNTWMSGHGPDTLGGARGTKWTEVYNNAFLTKATTNCGWVMATMYKSGTGVTYNNTFWDGSHRGASNSHGIAAGGCTFTTPVFMSLTYRRSEGTSYGARPCQSCACGDETTSTCDNKDMTGDPGKGRICWDQTGSRRGANNSGRTLGYAFAQEPVLYWNNKWADTSSLIAPGIYGDDPPTDTQVAAYLQERREYISDASCNGHMGETICSTFWDAVALKKKSYTAYTYPHPRTTDTSGTPALTKPDAPENLTVK